MLALQTTNDFPKPLPGAVIFDDLTVYACLANQPIAPGHVVVVWKKPVADIHLLSRSEFDHLMEIVDRVRTAMLATLKCEKVYLLYMDEIRHVHWHLVPR